VSQPPYIFISHSSQDGEFTDFLASRLEDAGFTTWVDLDSIPDGSTWPREIQKAVEGCGAMVVVMSKSGRDSEWVERETLLAMQLRKPLFIALIDDVTLPLHLINRQFSDFRKRRDAALTRLVTALRKTSLTEPLPQPKPAEQAKLSPDPNPHNIFAFIEQLPDGPTCARIARDLFAWARSTADAVTFSGRTNPAFHAHVWVGPGGLSIFSVRAYPKQPAVEVPLQYLKDFPPYNAMPERLAVLAAFNRLMPAADRFADEKADKRPNLPLATVLAPDAHLDAFKSTMTDIVARLRAAGG
jgi:hypothetical protein